MSETPVQAAGAAIRKAIEATQGPLPPAFVVEFLLSHWRRYLALTHRDAGPASEAWKAAVTATERLLWSVAPKATADDRNALSAALNPLLVSLRRGLDVAAMDEATRAAFLRQLADWHLSLISQASTPGSATQAAVAPLSPPASDADDAPLSDTISLDVNDPRYAKLLDMLQGGEVEEVNI